MVKPYDEERIIFGCYDITQTLKQKTRTKRAKGKEMEFAIHDEMDIAKITIKELLSAAKTKGALLQHSWYLLNTKEGRKRWWS